MLVRLCDCMIFVDAPLNFPARVETFGQYFFLLCLTHPTVGIEPASWIELYVRL